MSIPGLPGVYPEDLIWEYRENQDKSSGLVLSTPFEGPHLTISERIPADLVIKMKEDLRFAKLALMQRVRLLLYRLTYVDL